MTELAYKSDTKHRKQWFTGISFSHPAKMQLSLQIFLIDNFTKPGDVILDPMAGSGTVLVACSMGRHVITVELEDKFVKMQEGNWQKIRQRGPQMGYEMGNATILKGDARQLPDVLADAIISSPPYESEHQGGPDLHTERLEGSTSGLTSRRYTEVDSIISSPPYEGTEARDRSKDDSYRDDRELTHAGGSVKFMHGYQGSQENIGNLKSESYLEAMLQVYRNCFTVLKSGGTMVLVTKNYIRNKQIVRLDLDTIKLCETAGFTYTDRIERKLTQQSFWRIIYRQRYPTAPTIEDEDILIFKKEAV